MSIEVEIANIPEVYIVHSVNAVPDKVVVKGREELITKVTGAVDAPDIIATRFAEDDEAIFRLPVLYAVSTS